MLSSNLREMDEVPKDSQKWAESLGVWGFRRKTVVEFKVLRWETGGPPGIGGSPGSSSDLSLCALGQTPSPFRVSTPPKVWEGPRWLQL